MIAFRGARVEPGTRLAPDVEEGGALLADGVAQRGEPAVGFRPPRPRERGVEPREQVVVELQGLHFPAEEDVIPRQSIDERRVPRVEGPRALEERRALGGTPARVRNVPETGQGPGTEAGSPGRVLEVRLSRVPKPRLGL